MQREEKKGKMKGRKAISREKKGRKRGRRKRG